MGEVIYLLKLEWLKVYKYKTYWVLLLMFLILFAGVINIGLNVNTEGSLIDIMTYYRFPNVFANFAYVGKWISFFIIGFISVLSISNEFSNRTFRQNIINGLSRKELFASKVLFLVVISLLMSLVFVLFSLLSGLYYTKTYISEDFTPIFGYFIRFFLMNLGFGSLGLLIASIFRKTGISLFLYLAYVFIIEKFLRYVIHAKIIDNNSKLYYPSNSFEDLVPNPMMSMVKNMTGGASNLQFELTSTQAMITATIYIVIFIFISLYFLQKKDI